MRFPYIHRASYDWAIKQLEQRDARVRDLEAQNSELLHHILLLKKDGHVATPDYSGFIPTPPTVDEQDALRAEQMADDAND